MTSRVTSIGLFVVVDESEGCRQTLQYVGALAGEQERFRICLGYVLPFLPAELLEFGGAEDPKKEVVLGRQLKQEQKHWLSVARREARNVLQKAQSILRHANVARTALKTALLFLPEGQDPVDAIVKTAAAHQCHTIVIAKRPVSRLQELFGGDLAEKLVHRAHGPAIWVTSPTSTRIGKRHKATM